MKIEEITLKNFKSIKNINLKLKNLNILAGLNGSGKSSLIQSLLMLKQSPHLTIGSATLNNPEFISLGKGKDIFYQYGKEEVISISLVGYEVKLNWNFEYLSEAEILPSKNVYNSKEFEKINLFTNNFQYLHAERIGPRVTYKTSFSFINSIKQLDKYGEFAIHYLEVYGSTKVQNDVLKHKKAKSSTLLHQTEAWLGEITPGSRLNVTPIPGTELVLMDYQFETNIHKATGGLTNRFRPPNVGFGLSYVLPVILSLLTAEKDKLIIIENPEAHIHPKGQSELGRLIALASETGAQIIVETHSDHIINGIRVAVKQKDIKEENVNILFFEIDITSEEPFTKVHTIKVDNNGELSDYPENFLGEWGNQLLKLI